MEKQSIEGLVDKIVQNYFPEESPIYTMEKSDLFERAWSGNYSSSIDSLKGINQAGNATEMILGCIATIFATVKTVVELYKLNKGESLSSSSKGIYSHLLSEKWSLELQHAGMDVHKANALSRQFHKDLELVLTDD